MTHFLSLLSVCELEGIRHFFIIGNFLFYVCINLQLMDHLNSLPAFSEVLEPRVLTTHMVENPPGEWQLTSAHRPMERVPFVIQPGTKGIFNEQNPSSIEWKCRFNFFYAVHHEILLLLPQVCEYILFIC